MANLVLAITGGIVGDIIANLIYYAGVMDGRRRELRFWVERMRGGRDG